MDFHSIKCIFVGYGECNGIKGYRLYTPQNRKFFYSRSVTFDEEGLFQQARKHNQLFLQQDHIEPNHHKDVQVITTYDDGTLSSNESNQDSDASVCQNDQERGGKTMAETQQIHSVSPVINMIHTEQGERRLHIPTSSGKHSKRPDIHQ